MRAGSSCATMTMAERSSARAAASSSICSLTNHCSITVAGRSFAFSASAYRLLMEAVTSRSFSSTWAHSISAESHCAGGAATAGSTTS